MLIDRWRSYAVLAWILGSFQLQAATLPAGLPNRSLARMLAAAPLQWRLHRMAVSLFACKAARFVLILHHQRLSCSQPDLPLFEV